MKKSLNSFDSDFINCIKTIYNNETEGEHILSLSEIKRNGFIIKFSAVIFLTYLLILFNVSWEKIYWIYIISIIFGIIIANLITLLVLNNKIHKSFLYFDNNVLLSKKGNTIEYLPLSDIEKCLVFDKKDSEKFLNIRIVSKVNNKDSFTFEYSQQNKNLAESFVQNIMLLKSDTTKYHSQTELYRIIKNNEYSPQKGIKNNFLKKLIVFSLVGLIMFMYTPFCVDYNSFRQAKKVNTASSFRKYLGNKNNKLFIDEAKQNIKLKYDEVIQNYKNKCFNSDASNNMIKLL